MIAENNIAILLLTIKNHNATIIKGGNKMPEMPNELIYELVDRAPSMQDLHQLVSASNNDADFLKAIMERLQREDVPGDSTDYHNLSVCYGRVGDNVSACKLLEKGLNIFPYNIDLLADYVAYGAKIGDGGKAKCEEYCERLMQIPYKTWTWRAFSFLISYWQEQYPISRGEETVKIEERLYELCNNFQNYYPEDEASYAAEYDMLVAIGKKKEAIERLEEVVAEYEVVPKCCLRYCDLMLERGEYEKVIVYAEKGIMGDAQSQSGVSIGYLFFVSGLARDAMIWKEKKFDDTEAVNAMYSDFQIAEELFGNSHESNKKQINLRTAIMSRKSGIEYVHASKIGSDSPDN